MTTAELTPDDSPVSAFIPEGTLEAIPFPVVVYRTNGVLAAMNTAAEQYWRLPREHLVGKLNLYENRNLFSSNMLSIFNHAVAGNVTNSPPVLTDLTRSEELGRLSPKRAWNQSLLMPLRDATGHVVYILFFQRDVTDVMESRRETEAAMIEIQSQRQTIASLEAAYREIQQQKLTIAALSTPVIEVWDRVLTLPVVGHVTADRATAMTEQLLQAILRTQAGYAILDLTALSGVDTTTMDSFLRIMRAVDLLGAQGILVGVSSGVAQTMTSLGVDIGKLVIRRNLRQALSYCIDRQTHLSGS